METTLPAEPVPEYKPAPVPKLLSLPLPEMTMCAPKKKPNLEYHPEKPGLNASPAKKPFDEAASAPKYVPSSIANGAEDEWAESEKEEEAEEKQQQEQEPEQLKANLETELDELAKTTIEIKDEPQTANEETPKSDNEKKTSSSSSSARSESRKHEHKSRDSKERRSSSQKEKERSSGEHRTSSSKHKSSSSSSSHRKSSSSDKHRSEKKSSSKERSSSSKTATASTTSASSSSKSRHHSSSRSKSTSRSSSSSKSKSSNLNSHSSSSSNSKSSSSKSKTKAETDTSTSIELPSKPDDDFALDYEMNVDVSEAEIVRQCEMIFDELEQAFAQKPEETSTENVRKRKAPTPDLEAYTEAATAALQKRRVAHENADKCKPQAPVAVHKPNHIRNAMQAIFDRRTELRRQEKLRAEADAELLRQAQERVRIAQEELREARAKTLTPLISRSSLTPPTRTGELRLPSAYPLSISLA